VAGIYFQKPALSKRRGPKRPREGARFLSSPQQMRVEHISLGGTFQGYDQGNNDRHGTQKSMPKLRKNSPDDGRPMTMKRQEITATSDKAHREDPFKKNPLSGAPRNAAWP